MTRNCLDTARIDVFRYPFDDVFILLSVLEWYRIHNSHNLNSHCHLVWNYGFHVNSWIYNNKKHSQTGT
jgi:hypothetical protein